MKLASCIWIGPKGYQGSSKFEFWQKVRDREILEISIELAPPGRNGNKLYATKVTVKNLDTKETFSCSLTEITNYLDKLDYTTAHIKEE